jgi:hypothetical protein
VPGPALLVAYRGTSYRVVDGQGRVLAEARVDRVSPSIDALLAEHGARRGVFLTAWNPSSVAQSAAANHEAHARLLGELDRRGVRYLPHVGVGADPSWSEDGVFALALPADQAAALAAAHGQNAIVVVAVGEPAALIFTA